MTDVSAPRYDGGAAPTSDDITDDAIEAASRPSLADLMRRAVKGGHLKPTKSYASA